MGQAVQCVGKVQYLINHPGDERIRFVVRAYTNNGDIVHISSINKTSDMTKLKLNITVIPGITLILEIIHMINDSQLPRHVTNDRVILMQNSCSN